MVEKEPVSANRRYCFTLFIHPAGAKRNYPLYYLVFEVRPPERDLYSVQIDFFPALSVDR